MKVLWQSVRKDEWPVTLALILLYGLIIASFTLTKIARDSLFLAALPVEQIPYVYFGVAAVSIVVVGILARVNIVSHRRLLGIVLLLTGVALMAMVWLAGRAPRVAPVLVYLWNGSIGTVMIAEFWLLANQRIDARQARRIFGPVGAAGVVGGLAAGAAATAVGPFIDSKWLLAAAAVLCVAGFLSLRSRALAGSLPVAPARSESPVGEARSHPFGGRYIRLLVGLFILVGVTGSVLDYAFKMVLQAEVVEQGKIASALGALYSVQNVAALVTQLGITAAILTRFGSRRAANILPAGIFAGTLIAIGLPAAAAAVAIVTTRTFDAVMRTSLARTAWEFLYYPLDDKIKQNVKRFIDVVVNRAADAAAGALILGLTFVFGGSLIQVAVMLVALTVVWLTIEVALNRGYADEVARSLERVAPRRAAQAFSLRDVSDESSLEQLLRDGDDKKVRYAIGLLEALDPEALARHADELLSHEASSVRTRALAALIATGRSVGELDALLASSAPPADAVNEIEPVFSLSDEERVLDAARAVDDTDEKRAVAALTAAMESPHTDVRRVAYLSAGRSGNRALLPLLVARLSQHAERLYAREALIAFGPRAVGTLGDYLVDASTSPSMRRELATALVRIGTQDSAYSLYRATHPENDLNTVCMALRFLNKMRADDSGLALPDSVLQDDLNVEIERYAQSVLRYPSAMKDWGESLRALFERVLTERHEKYLESIFLRLALVSSAQEAMNAYGGITSADKRIKAQAIEYLDTHLPRAVKERFIPLLDAGSGAERARQAAKILDTPEPDARGIVRGLFASAEPWLAACALFLVGSRKMNGFEVQISSLRESQDGLVRDAAAWAARQLGEAVGDTE